MRKTIVNLIGVILGVAFDNIRSVQSKADLEFMDFFLYSNHLMALRHRNKAIQQYRNYCFVILLRIRKTYVVFIVNVSEMEG